jgi:hypothetical protein
MEAEIIMVGFVAVIFIAALLLYCMQNVLRAKEELKDEVRQMDKDFAGLALEIRTANQKEILESRREMLDGFYKARLDLLDRVTERVKTTGGTAEVINDDEWEQPTMEELLEDFAAGGSEGLPISDKGFEEVNAFQDQEAADFLDQIAASRIEEAGNA